jgi:uncharacterized protein YndB with AHSA1/START domain
MIAIERTYDAPAEEVWRLWTTPEGIEAWWPPDGFECTVHTLDLEPGGELLYTFTAVDPAQVEFMQQAGLPLSIDARKTFTEVVPTTRLAYRSVVDFVPGVEPYDQLTVVELEPADGGVRAVMQMEPLHDDEWTQRLVAGRENELDNLAKLLAGR